jgi:hypothetical protein
MKNHLRAVVWIASFAVLAVGSWACSSDKSTGGTSSGTNDSADSGTSDSSVLPGMKAAKKKGEACTFVDICEGEATCIPIALNKNVPDTTNGICMDPCQSDVDCDPSSEQCCGLSNLNESRCFPKTLPDSGVPVTCAVKR